MKRFKVQQTCLVFMMLIFLITGCGGHGGETDKWLGTEGGGTGGTAPKVISTNPLDIATDVCYNKIITAKFSKAMLASTITAPGTFTVQDTTTPGAVGGIVTYDAATRTATFTLTAFLTAGDSYTATITTAATDLHGKPLAVDKIWSFTAGSGICAPPAGSISLGLASTFGTFGGSAGMTNTGNETLITGTGGNTADIGTISTGNATITGFHEKTGTGLDDCYSDTLGPNSGQVTGLIYTCAVSTTGDDSGAVDAPECAIATQARLDAQAAYIALAAMPSNGPLAGNLANSTITPGVYTNASSVLIQGGDLTLDAGGNADAVFVFQIGSTLTVGGPGVAAPQSITLAGNAQPKNIFWQVGSNAIINAGAGGTMVGTIIASSGVVFSTAGKTDITTLEGRALSLVASVTMVNTVIHVPAP